MKTTLTAFALICGMALVVTLSVSAQEADPAKLVENLGSDDFDTRESA